MMSKSAHTKSPSTGPRVVGCQMLLVPHAQRYQLPCYPARPNACCSPTDGVSWPTPQFPPLPRKPASPCRTGRNSSQQCSTPRSHDGPYGERRGQPAFRHGLCSLACLPLQSPGRGPPSQPQLCIAPSVLRQQPRPTWPGLDVIAPCRIAMQGTTRCSPCALRTLVAHGGRSAPCSRFSLPAAWAESAKRKEKHGQKKKTKSSSPAGNKQLFCAHSFEPPLRSPCGTVQPSLLQEASVAPSPSLSCATH